MKGSSIAIAPLSVAALLVVAAMAALGTTLWPTQTSAAPRPGQTGSGQVVVTIPGATSTPTPTPSKSGGGSGDDGTDLPTLPIEPTAPPVPSGPTADAEGLQLDRTRIEAGQTIVATGTGYSPGESVQFVLYSDPVVIGSFAADSDGTVVARIDQTDDLRLGEHTVEATGWQSGRVANATFVVVSPAGDGFKWFPWIVWIIAGAALVLGAIGYIIGAARGWLPTPSWARRKSVS